MPRARRPRRRLLGAVASALCAAPCGCSIVLVDGPPEGYREMESFSCTEGDAIPILDVLWSVANGVAAAQAMIEPTTPDRREIIVLGSSMSVTAGVSAAIGFRRRTACRQARVEVARLRQVRPGTDTVASPPAGPVSGASAVWWPRASVAPPLTPGSR